MGWEYTFLFPSLPQLDGFTTLAGPTLGSLSERPLFLTLASIKFSRNTSFLGTGSPTGQATDASPGLALQNEPREMKVEVLVPVVHLALRNICCQSPFSGPLYLF